MKGVGLKLLDSGVWCMAFVDIGCKATVLCG